MAVPGRGAAKRLVLETFGWILLLAGVANCLAASLVFALRKFKNTPGPIRAEITANVWQVVAEEGQMVAEGDEICILESMKMEIPVLAESDGTLDQLAVNEGDVVQEGDLIAQIG